MWRLDRLNVEHEGTQVCQFGIKGDIAVTQPKSTLLIHNGRVVTPVRLIDKGAVHVEGDTIRAVGEEGEIKAPAHASLVDANGAIIARQDGVDDSRSDPRDTTRARDAQPGTQG